MTYQEGMFFLSQCGLGAVLASENNDILEVNESGDKLLHGGGELPGKSLREVAPPFCGEAGGDYFNIDFGEYLALCPNPELCDLPAGTRLIVFRDARNDACHDMLMRVVNQISEALILCDESGRVFMLNDAAVKMDSLLPQNIVGQHVSSIYTMDDETELVIPRVIHSKLPILNLRQHYTTCYGKKVDIMSNNYPVIVKNSLLGGFSIMEDWSQIDKLSKQVIDLQSQLLNRSAAARSDKNRGLSAKYHFRDIIHNSAAMDGLIRKCQRIAKSDSSVMIYGETGTGKELLAQSIHNASQRADGPFLAINCAAIPENLLESLLFGTEKGAYTGAERREGLFEQANHGTLLLDEINSMNISLQSKLLRVLQDGMVRHVGGVSEIRVDVRVLSNTNVPPYQAMEENKLRRDLFYRLGVVNLNIPPLRERMEDIPLLAKCFILNFNRKLLKNVIDIDAEVLNVFNSYDWPGNVRELQHAIEYAMNIMPEDVSTIILEYIPEHILGGQAPDIPIELKSSKEPSLENIMSNMEYRMLCKTLKENNGNISKTARVLGMSRQNIQYRIKRNKIDVQALISGRSPEEI